MIFIDIMKPNNKFKYGKEKAFKKANREIEMEKHPTGWAANDKPFKPKNKYNRNKDKKEYMRNLNIAEGIVEDVLNTEDLD